MDNSQLILWILTSCNPLCKYDNARFKTVTLKPFIDHRGPRTLCVYLSNCCKTGVYASVQCEIFLEYLKQFEVFNNHKRFCRLKRVCTTSMIKQRFKWNCCKSDMSAFSWKVITVLFNTKFLERKQVCILCKNKMIGKIEPWSWLSSLLNPFW